MPTHLYCLLPRSADAVPPPASGIGGAPVRALDAGAITAWVGTVPDDAPAPDAAALRAHDAVAAAALAVATPLPARFGQRYASDESCRSALAGRTTALLARLEEVAGCVEMRILVAPPPGSGASPAATPRSASAGRAYLERVRARVHGERALHERAAALRASFATAAGPLARRDAVAVHPGSAAPVAIAHLVRREDVPAWRAAVEAMVPDVRGSGERLVLAGPGAPYAFAETTDDGTG